jgi:hypothetical protein
MSGISNTSNDTFRRLFGNGLSYRIPKYQRDYSWDSEQWSDLWYDVQEAGNTKSPHYMGYLVLQTSDNKIFHVIDGQQRLTTVSILILACIKHLRCLPGTAEETKDNEKRAETIRSSYIGNLDPKTLVSYNKLVLNKNNDAFYRRFLTPLAELPQRKLNTSEKLMKRAFEFFYQEIKKRFSNYEDIINYIDALADNIFFTAITVTDELNAFKVFETLNARGVQLSASDLLKNLFFSRADSEGAHESEIEELESYWNGIIGKLEGGLFSEYLRCFWNGTHSSVRKNMLYRVIRDEIKDISGVFSMLRELHRMADVYVALQTPSDELWQNDKKITENLQRLKDFGVSQPLSLLLIAYDKLPLDDFKRLLSAVVVISFRYNIICGKNPNEQEHIYNKLAVDIAETARLNLQTLMEIYVSDNEFEQSFSEKEFKNSSRNHKIVRYILAKIENHNSRVSLDPEALTLEHILPENPNLNDWNFEPAFLDHWICRIGNMTLLDKQTNKDLGNKKFREKQLHYAQSDIPMTRELSDGQLTEWTAEAIVKRQEALAKTAKTVWRVW